MVASSSWLKDRRQDFCEEIRCHDEAEAHPVETLALQHSDAITQRRFRVVADEDVAEREVPRHLQTNRVPLGEPRAAEKEVSCGIRNRESDERPDVRPPLGAVFSNVSRPP